ncbi:MAG TPA: alpha/beta hydrolase-fold protein [Bryobacteraceae bacterium]|nr:alpha/beta hydrolase-fold protein [Bryobacteraceae bacterium]
MFRLPCSALPIGLVAALLPALAQTPAPQEPAAATQPNAPQTQPAKPQRTPPPTRDPNTPGYVKAKEMPDGELPSPKDNGNFVIGPTYKPAPEMTVKEGVPQGQIFEFTIDSKDSKIYPGISRDRNTPPQPDPNRPGQMIIASVPTPYTRKVAVYVPKQYVPGTEAPLLVGTDGPDRNLFIALDNLIAEKRVPAMIAVSIAHGGGDGQGSQRGLEYDTMSGKYAEFVETEVLPLVEKQYNLKLTRDPDGRAAMGCSSGAAAAMSMAWYRTDLYHRVLSYSGTFVYQQYPFNAETPHGAWDYHETLIPNSAKKPLRIWMHVSDRDNLSTRDAYHDWVLANERMAKVLTDKGYPYQFVFTKNSGHCDRAVKAATLPLALEYVWQGYKPKK